MDNNFKHVFSYRAFALVLMLAAGSTRAQGPGSADAHNSTEYTMTGTTVTIAAESLYFGPATNWTVDGTLEVYSKNVWIAPGAQLKGAGTIRFHNPVDAGGASSATLLDGNNNTAFTDINLELLNASGLTLTDLADPGYGANTPGNATFNIGKNLMLGIDNGHITLNGYNLVFDNDATISSYGNNRMVITSNSISGHVVKQNYSTAFTFPVGIAAGNYSPATITPAATATTYVSVQDYANTGAVVNIPSEGMGLVWHIYADAASTVTLSLLHNTAGGSGYTDNLAFITQYMGGGMWSTAAASGYVSPGLHTYAGISLPAAASNNGAWFSKASDMASPLPITLTDLRVQAINGQCLLSWVTLSEQHNKGFQAEHSTDGINWKEIGFTPSLAPDGNSSQNLRYSFTHPSPAQGQNVYRLKQINHDGSVTYSNMVTATVSIPDKILVSPNPSDGPVTISGLAAGYRILVYDAQGHLLISKITKGNTDVILPGSQPAGTYYINIIKNNGERVYKKVIITR